MDAPFSNGKLLPPAHPSCRCAVAFEEVPNTNDSQNHETLDFEILGQYTGERLQDVMPKDSDLTPVK